MKLKKQLESFKGKYVKLGSEVSFVYCGINDDDIENTLVKLSDEELKELKRRLAVVRIKLDNFVNLCGKRYAKGVVRFLKEKPEPTIEEFDEYKKLFAAEMEKELIQMAKLKNKLEERILTFTPFLTREVLEIHDSCVEENTKIIKFEGEEQGRFWDKEEYNKWLNTGVIPEEDDEDEEEGGQEE